MAARTSSFAFQGKSLGILEIAARLHVANVLEGSVRKAGDEVRISVQLVRASDGYEIWSQSYDRKLDDIFAIQNGIAADVVKNLKIELLGALPTVRKTDPKAYALYLQARELGRKFTADAFKSSDALYQQALAIRSALRAGVERSRRKLPQRDGHGRAAERPRPAPGARGDREGTGGRPRLCTGAG